MRVVRIKFRAGAYATAKALIKEINRGLKVAFHDIWSKYVTPDKTEDHYEDEPVTNIIHLTYDKIYDRVLFQIDGTLLREKNLMCVRFPLSLAYKLGFGQKSLFTREDPNVAKFLKVYEYQN